MSVPNRSFGANSQSTVFWHNVRMSEEHILALRQADQARTDFAALESDLEFIMGDSHGCRREAI